MIELRELTPRDGLDVYEMVKEIESEENGFVNSLLADTYEDFQEKLIRNDEISKGINLGPGYVPQTIYWLYVDGSTVGYGKLRHYLNDHLKQHGGHIGYVMTPSARKQGYGKQMLAEIIKKAKEKQIAEVLVTCDETNIASRKVIEANNGKLVAIKDDSCFYWITCNKAVSKNK